LLVEIDEVPKGELNLRIPEVRPAPHAPSVSTPVEPAVPSPRAMRRRRALVLLFAVVLIFGLWWVSGYIFAYTDDAYVDSDVVQVTPEIAGPLEAVRVSDNQWVKRGSVLFIIDPTPFELQLEQATAREQEARAQLPVDEATIESLRAQK
jgi:multidrug resistance efflux pump